MDKCPKCNGQMFKNGIKSRYSFYVYECRQCGHEEKVDSGYRYTG